MIKIPFSIFIIPYQNQRSNRNQNIVALFVKELYHIEIKDQTATQYDVLQALCKLYHIKIKDQTVA